MRAPNTRSTERLHWVYQPFEGARLVRAHATKEVRPKPEYLTQELFGQTRLKLESGNDLGPIRVAYETYGKLSSARDNAILVCHALTGDSHVSSHRVSGSKPGWWEGMVGRGCAIDTDRFFVVCTNVLGGCGGTTGPGSLNPKTGRRYGPTFPAVTVRDMVKVQREALSHLGVDRVLCVIGGSMGGMQALEWATLPGGDVLSAIVIAAPGRMRAQAIAYNEVQRQAIYRDPAWKGGWYRHGRGPSAGLSLARMLGMITYQSEQSMDSRFKQATSVFCADSTDCATEVRRYLHYQGEKLAERFDANTYLCLLKAIDLFDITREGLSYAQVLARIRCRMLVVGISSDILYPPHQQRELVADLAAAGCDASYAEVQSILGHDAFLTETAKVGSIVRGFLDKLWSEVQQ